MAQMILSFGLNDETRCMFGTMMMARAGIPSWRRRCINGSLARGGCACAACLSGRWHAEELLERDAA